MEWMIRLANETTVNKDELISSQFLPLKLKYPCTREINTLEVNFLHKLNARLTYYHIAWAV